MGGIILEGRRGRRTALSRRISRARDQHGAALRHHDTDSWPASHLSHKPPIVSELL